MPLDYLSVKQQIQKVARRAPAEQERMQQLRQQARDLLNQQAHNGAELCAKVELAASRDSALRAAKPGKEALTQSFLCPAPLEQSSVIAADGSQISPSRHEAVNYFLINVGAIHMHPGSGDAPNTHTFSDLHVQKYGEGGSFGNDQVGQMRDKAERLRLVEMVGEAQIQPAITLVDGPLELWGGRDRDPAQQAGFLKNLEEYLDALKQTQALGALTAGYEDKSRRDLVVRCLEIGQLPREQIEGGRFERGLRGVLDRDLFADLLAPGERSAVIEIQHQFAEKYYAGPLALHCFYLKIGREEAYELARVEVPGWVAEDTEALDAVHATLVEQCRLTGSRPYPYALHRAHEIAVVSHEERKQVTQMLMAGLQAAGVDVGTISNKQALKELERRAGW